MALDKRLTTAPTDPRLETAATDAKLKAFSSHVGAAGLTKPDVPVGAVDIGQPRPEGGRRPADGRAQAAW